MGGFGKCILLPGTHSTSRSPGVAIQAASRRLVSTKTAPPKSYASTLLLPKTKFKLWPNYAARQMDVGRRANESLYAWQWANNKGPVFILHDGPPYANGALHMGHALNKILKDIINRFQVLLGKRVNYIPGWDCHGLPTEIKTLERLKATPNSLPPADVRRHAERFAREQIKSQMKEFQNLSIMASWDDSNTYRTIDSDYEIRQLRLLQKLVQKNLIYRRHRPVLWSPSSVTALAEAEVQYVDDHISRSAYITFRITSAGHGSSHLGKVMEEIGQTDIHFLVWTTTPWTIPANMGIAVNPDMQYVVARTEGTPECPMRVLILGADLLGNVQTAVGKLHILATLTGNDLVGTRYTNVFSSPHLLRVLASKHVTATSGTGVVHMAPAHGAEDYAAFLANGLLNDASVVCPVDDTGRFSSEIINLSQNPDYGKRLAGKAVLGNGTDEILAILEESGVLLANERYKHRYPYDSRTNNPMITRATSQWFTSVGDMKEGALSALENVKFHPESARSRLESFIRERTEWCISRQRVWGSPIPSLHDVQTGEAILSAESLEHIIPILEKKGVSYWWIGPVEDFIPAYLRDSGRQYTKGTDTIDVWFDSGSSWTMLEALFNGKESHRGVPHQVPMADVCLEGSDQHRGWFQSLLLTAVGTTNDGQKSAAPFKNLITHGFVLDEDGKKMSKSVGNIISPMTVIAGGKDRKREPAYGVDVLRLWAAGVDYTKDVSVGHASLAQVAEGIRKLRNTARFMLGNLADGEPSSAKSALTKGQMTLLDRYVMHELYELETRAKASYENFNVHSVVQSLTSFSNSVLSALYFDVAKDVLYADDMNSVSRCAVVAVLENTLDVYTSILAPILPQLAEEIHDSRKRSTNQEASVFQFGWNSTDEQWKDFALAKRMGILLRLRDRALQLIEAARREGRLRSALESVIEIRLQDKLPDDAESQTLRELVQAHADELKALLIVSDVSVTAERVAGLRSVSSPEWELSCNYRGLGLYLRPSTMHKCPRCWQYNALEEDTLCVRCRDVVRP